VSPVCEVGLPADVDLMTREVGFEGVVNLAVNVAL